MTYTQCTLTRGTRTTVAWVPSKFARPDNVLILKDGHCWVVTELGAKMSQQFVEARRDDYRYQRRVSDV